MNLGSPKWMPGEGLRDQSDLRHLSHFGQS